MARVVYVPELGRSFSFKDGATDQEVSSFFQSAFPAPAEPAQAPPEGSVGPWESAGLGWLSRFQTTGGGIAEMLGAEDTAKYLYDKAQANLEEAAKYKPEETSITGADTWSGSASALGEAAIQSAPDLAGGLAAAYAGGQLGAIAGPVGAGIGALIGGGLYAFGSSAGSNIQRQAQEANIPLQQANEGVAFTAAAMQAPLDALADKIMLGRLIPSGVPLGTVRKIVGDGVVKHAAKGALAEGLTEVAQQAIEIGQANPEKLFSFAPEVQTELIDAAVAGGFLGGAVGGVATPLERYADYRRAEPQRQLVRDIRSESAQNVEKVRLGKIAQAAENIRQTGVQGSVNIEEDIFDGLPVFNIKAPDGKTIAQFTDDDGRAKDSAIAAVNLYSKNTGVKAEPNIIPKTPEASAETEIPDLQVDFDTEISEPPPAPGMTRVYHSGARGEGETGRWVSTNKTYASDYRRDLPLFYTDLPSDDPRVSPDPLNPNQGVKQGFTFNFELAPEEAVKLRRIKRDEKPKAPPVETPIGAVEAEETPAAEEAVAAEPISAEPVGALPASQFTAPETEPIAGVEPAPDVAPEVTQEAPVEVPSAPLEAPEVAPEAAQAAADVTPKSLREAYAAGPKIAAPTKEVSEKFRNVYEALTQRLSSIAPPDVTLGLREFIETESPDVLIKGLHNVEKSGGQTKSIIDLATGIYDPDLTTDQLVSNLLDVLNHEMIHALRRNGLIRPAEWRILSRAVTEANVPGRKYTYLDKAQAVYNEKLDPAYADQDAVVEEAVAELYKDWVRNGKAPAQTRGLLNRITEFFRRIFRTLRDNKYEDVFKAIESGDVRGREPVVETELEVRPSVKQASPATDTETTKAPESSPPKVSAEGPRFSAAPALGSDEFNRWFRDSKVVNEDGSPKVQYHGTNVSYRNFKQFDTGLSELGTHFGTQAQANEFVKDVPPDPDEDATIVNDRIYPVYLSIQNPLRMQDANRWSTGRMARRLRDMGFLSPEEAATIERMPINHITAIRMLQDAIRKAGYDGVVYLNRSEGIPTKVDPNDKLDMSDDDFRAKYGAEDSYIVFSPEQVKSVFNQFPYGEAESPRFSAAPMSPYLQAQNDSMFAEPPKLSFSEKIFDYIFGYKPYNREYMRVAVRANLVDKTAAITHLEKKLNLRDNNIFDRYVADYSATAAITQRRRASHLTASTIMMGNPKVNFADPGNILSATLSVEENPDSIMKIAEILTNSGPVDPATGLPQDLSNVFRTYATAIRGRDLRAKGLAVPRYITPQYVNEALTSIPRDYPQVVEAYDMYQRYNKRLMEAARDSGLFSDAEFSRLTRDSNYYGFYRELYQEELAPTATTKTAGEFKFREYKGSEEGGLINDPLFVIIRNSQFLIESMAKNIATTKSYDVARRMGEAQLLARGQDPDLSQGFQKDIMYFKDKGVLKRFAVKDPLLVTALGSDDRVVLGKAIDLLGMPASILRETVTRDPAFMVANLLRDTVSSWITSGEDITPFIGTAKGMVSAYKQSASFKALMGRGVVGSYDMAMIEPADIANTIRRRTMPKNIHTVTSISGATGAIQSLWDRLGQLSEASDAATRIAVYEAARRQGMSEAEASLRAVEIMDFSRRGASHLLNIMTKTIPFLNARIQGLDVLYQSMVSGKRFIMGQSVGERDANIGRRFLVRGAMLAAISIALEMYNQDDEDYKQLDSYIKDGNLLFPLRDFGMPGEFIAIPKPFEAGLLFSTFPQTMYKYFVSDQASNRDVANLFFSQFASTFGVNPLPQILIPPLEIITNHDFYTGLPLISEGKMRLDPSLQYDSRTSTVAMMISNIPFVYDVNTGEFRGPSPIAVDQLISGYTGPIGSYIAMAVGAAMSVFDAGPERMPMEISQAPVIRRFFVDAEAKNPAVVTQAYELFRIVDEANRTFSRLRQANDAEALLDYYEERKDVLAYKKYIFKLVDRLNKLSAYERQIERDKDLTDEEKIAAKRNIREMRIRVAAQVSEINKKLGR